MLGGNICWGYDAPAANGQLQPIPGDSATAAPATDTGPATVYPDMGESPAVESDECTEFCGMPCCSPPGRFWLRADYLMWWTNGMRLPPLVTTSPQGTPLAQAGALPYSTILYGNSTIANSDRSGFRTSWGLWLDNCHNWGIEGDYFALGRGAGNFSQFSNGDPILARPLYDVENVQQGRQLVAYPNVVEGTVTVHAKDYFQSAGVDLVYNLCCCDSCNECGDPCVDSCVPLLYGCRTDLLLGYRYYKYSDSLAIQEDLRDTSTGATANTTYLINDDFRARNDFQGSEFGLRTRIYRGRWSLEILSKIAVGNNHQVVNISGHSVITTPNQPAQIYNAGVFAGRTQRRHLYS